MRVRLIKPFLNGRTVLHPPAEIEVTPTRGAQLLANKLVIEAVGGRMVGREATVTDPIITPPPGGPIGEASVASSRRRGRPRRISTLAEPKAEPDC